YRNSCSFSRTTSTEQGAARATASAVLPMVKYFQPVRPCAARTIRSMSSSLADSRISCVTLPARTMEVMHETPAAFAESASACNLRSVSASACSQNAAVATRAPNNNRLSGSRTWGSVRAENCARTKRSAKEKAFFDAGEKSVGIKSFWRCRGNSPSPPRSTSCTFISAYLRPLSEARSPSFGESCAFFALYPKDGKGETDLAFRNGKFFYRALRCRMTAESIEERRTLGWLIVVAAGVRAAFGIFVASDAYLKWQPGF